MMMNRGDLSNEQWERLKPLLPPEKPLTGRPNNDHRTVDGSLITTLGHEDAVLQVAFS
ncbi:MAG: hypothetical protein RM022_012935 [Nostoc sp. EfeVER01]|uniref:hypothetical protein n=2 Tax=unclassified Nostoc TaxID=2593658 RepID=UPI00394E0FF1